MASISAHHVSTLHEERARARKAYDLCQAAHRNHTTAEQVAADPDTRAELVYQTGCIPASARTWAVVIGLLERIEEGGRTTGDRSVIPTWLRSQRRAQLLCECCGERPQATEWAGSGELICWECCERKRTTR